MFQRLMDRVLRVKNEEILIERELNEQEEEYGCI